MRRRTVVRAGAAIIGAGGLPRMVRAQAPQAIRIGCAVSLSGPDAAEAQLATWLPYKLWARDVNDAGGIMLRKYGVKVPVELIDYDDRSETDLAVRLTERLIVHDRVDLVLPPWGTAANLATAPVFSTYAHPVIHSTALSERIVRLALRWPWSFWASAQPDAATRPLAAMVKGFAPMSRNGGRIAVLHVADQTGIEMADAMQESCKRAGMSIAHLQGYPSGASDLSMQIRAAMAAGADAFFVFGSSSDTVLITEQSQMLGFNPALYYAARGASLPAYAARFGARKNGVLMYGGVSPEAPGQEEYRKRHRAIYNHDVGIDSIGTYATLQILQAAIERVGEIDRRKIRDTIAEGRFGTIADTYAFEDQLYPRAWAVSQWQGDQVAAVAPDGKHGVGSPLFPKPSW